MKRPALEDPHRYKYPPWWASVPEIFAAMQDYVPGPFTTPRGYIEVTMPRDARDAGVVV